MGFLGFLDPGSKPSAEWPEWLEKCITDGVGAGGAAGSKPTSPEAPLRFHRHQASLSGSFSVPVGLADSQTGQSSVDKGAVPAGGF